MDSTLAYYAREADRIARGPQVYGGDVKIASLAAFRRYHKDAHWDIPDSDGVLRWVTAKQMRVYGIIARISLSPDGTGKMIDIAVEAQCCTSTVSRTILKLQGWGLFAVDVRRGRNGGITVLRPSGSWMTSYVRAARQKIRDLSNRARIKLASIIPLTEMVGTLATDDLVPYLDNMDASFTGRRSPTFTDKVFYERAMLALTDPEGEYEAVHPLIDREEIDNALLLAEDVLRRQDEVIRQAAFRGDWDEWERLRKVRWG